MNENEGRVIDSVQQLTAECAKMLNIADEMNYVDISIAASILRGCVKDMNKVYEEDISNTIQLIKRKKEVEINAIRLEYFIQVQGESTYKERFALRTLLKNFYEDVHDVFMHCSKGRIPMVNSVNLVDWATYLSFAVKLSERSYKLLTSITEDEMALVRDISNKLKLIYESNPDLFKDYNVNGKEKVVN